MNAFVNAVKSPSIARTENGMKAYNHSGNACLDLFYGIGAMRGQNPVPLFLKAFVENEDIAIRVLLWARDVRGGAGERDTFRKIVSFLETENKEIAKRVLAKIPEIGRWDDIFIFKDKEMKEAAYTLLGDALRNKNGLAAKWTPREGSAQGKIATEIRNFFGMTPRQYRKQLVALTNVVETAMCQKNWEGINFSHVPSVASANYKKAFLRNAPELYKAYLEKLVKGDKTVKVNASAIFPHDVIKDVFRGYASTEAKKLVKAQWDALPNYIGDSSVLAMVDVSGSMNCPVGGNNNLNCLQVALSLGLYTADKNRGAFKDTFLTFSTSPELLHLKGDITQKIAQLNSSTWDMSTNIIGAFKLILKTAKNASVPQEDMPKTLLILSDMQFDQCARFDRSAFETVQAEYEAAGYVAPNVVFWNLKASGNTPVKSDTSGAALVSGFSPSLLKNILGGEEYTPQAIMLRTVMDDRYAF